MRPSGRMPDQLRAVSFERGLHQACRGLLPGALRRYACAVHGDARRARAAMAQGSRQGLGHRRIWHAAARHRRAHAQGSGARASNRAAPRKSSGWSAARSAPSWILQALGEKQITLDCDVLQADGGTRTAAITGSWVALHDCLKWMEARAMFKACPLKDHVAAISCGIHRRRRRCSISIMPRISTAGTDANFVMTGSGGIVEIQGTAETEPFSQEQLLEFLGLARKGIGELVALQKQTVA